jgi:hypothetical protein
MATISQWPVDLLWILGRLTPTEFQRFTQIQPEEGPPIRHATSAPLPALEGVVELNEMQWLALDRLYTLPQPITADVEGKPTLVTFPRAPFVERSSSDSEGTKTRMVRLLLLVKSP